VNSPYHYDQRYFFQSVTLPSLPAAVILGGTTYIAKPEFHCSLLAVKRVTLGLARERGVSESDAETQIVAAIKEVLADIKPKFTSFTSEYRIVEKPEEDKKTIVALVNIEHLKNFIDRIATLLETSIPIPIAHITLYTLENGAPIGLVSEQEYQQRSRPMTEQEARDWHETAVDDKLVKVEA
jgi:hypothetical protein